MTSVKSGGGLTNWLLGNRPSYAMSMIIQQLQVCGAIQCLDADVCSDIVLLCLSYMAYCIAARVALPPLRLANTSYDPLSKILVLIYDVNRLAYLITISV